MFILIYKILSNQIFHELTCFKVPVIAHVNSNNKLNHYGNTHVRHHYVLHSLCFVLPVLYWYETGWVWATTLACVTLSGNSGAGFSQCISLPVPIAFQYSGNLRSSWEVLADTTQQPVSGRGTITRETERETWDKQRARGREGGIKTEKVKLRVK